MLGSGAARWCRGLSLIVALAASTSDAAEHTPGLAAVQFAPAGDDTQVVLSLTASARFHASLATPSRALIDIDGCRPTQSAAAGSGFGLIHGFHAETRGSVTRVVLDLARPAKLVTARAEAAHGRTASRIVIEFAPTDPIAAVAQGVVLQPPRAAAPATKAVLRLKTARAPAAPAPTARAPDPVPPPPSVGTPASGLAAAALKSAPVRAMPTGRRTIVIDAGHGGIDPGAESVTGYHEKEITLATARVLRRLLEDTGRYRVVLTRDRDIYLKLGQRVALGRAAGGNLFISLHADSVAGAGGGGGARGASIYTLSETASDAESERLAQQENHADLIGGGDISDSSGEVLDILADLTMRETVGGGNRLASMLVDSFAHEDVDLFPRTPHRSAGFAVLKAPDIPSVLIEMGYLSDPGEARLLESSEYEARIGRAVVAGIDRYFAWVEASRS